jgi:hypothetical protein
VLQTGKQTRPITLKMKRFIKLSAIRELSKISTIIVVLRVVVVVARADNCCGHFPHAKCRILRALQESRTISTYCGHFGQLRGAVANSKQLSLYKAHFTASIPFSYSKNPITHTDWEGVGIEPDVIVPARHRVVPESRVNRE